MLLNAQMIKKYDIPGPRYTSYPTAPNWTDNITHAQYVKVLDALSQSDKTISLYIHIPFCESMCTYCACSVILRKKDEKYGEEYLKYLFKEIELVSENFKDKKTLRQLHWGGGTPTFLTEDQIIKLYKKIEEHFIVDKSCEVAIEIDPRTVSFEKIKVLKNCGFNRISFGVQDFDPKVQQSVNRIQPFNMVNDHYEFCRNLGFNSINFDLIYGLPHQNKESFLDTINKVIDLKPDRIALYSFAYVPWLKKHQNKINEDSLPKADDKLELFLLSRSKLLDSHYISIAMDHFALEEDELAISLKEGTLHRNFMGYTVKPADEYIGLGVSSIGHVEHAFIQNVKTLPEYYELLDNNQLPVLRGKFLSKDDQIRQWTIWSLMCLNQLNKSIFANKFDVIFEDYYFESTNQIQKLCEDGLIIDSDNSIVVTEKGRLFVRNISMVFDAYLNNNAKKARFSQTV